MQISPQNLENISIYQGFGVFLISEKSIKNCLNIGAYVAKMSQIQRYK